MGGLFRFDDAVYNCVTGKPRDVMDVQDIHAFLAMRFDRLKCSSRPWRKQRMWSESGMIAELEAIELGQEAAMTMRFKRITVDPAQMGGVPCLRGLRIPVATVVGLVAQGMAEEQIMAEYPDLESEDIREALRYAAAAVDERVLPLRPSA